MIRLGILHLTLSALYLGIDEPKFLIALGDKMITGPLCRAARALVELSRDNLARVSKIDSKVIENFENQINTPSPDVVAALKEALENKGAVFIPEDERGAGVRLKFTRSEANRIAILESEGGIAAPDDVP